VYTAYLFAQSKARDLWQNPLLPPHMAVQAVLAGAAALVVAGAGNGSAADALGWTLAGACAAHLLMVAGEVTLSHPTAHAHLAAREMTSGRYSRFFRTGAVLVATGLLCPLGGPVAVLAALGALTGLLAHEHAYVQAGQSVPLA
jgi:hypothetical protein